MCVQVQVAADGKSGFCLYCRPCQCKNSLIRLEPLLSCQAREVTVRPFSCCALVRCQAQMGARYVGVSLVAGVDPVFPDSGTSGYDSLASFLLVHFPHGGLAMTELCL